MGVAKSELAASAKIDKLASAGDLIHGHQLEQVFEDFFKANPILAWEVHGHLLNTDTRLAECLYNALTREARTREANVQNEVIKRMRDGVGRQAIFAYLFSEGYSYALAKPLYKGVKRYIETDWEVVFRQHAAMTAAWEAFRDRIRESGRKFTSGFSVKLS